jgi:hypothetical protein
MKPMHSLDMPAGSTMRLTATARSEVAAHRWAVRVFAAGAGAEAPRLVYGSHIGDGDRQQRIDFPAQDMDCRLEVRARHATTGGEWADDKLTVLDEEPGRLALGFSDASQAVAHDNDVVLSFVLTDGPQTDRYPCR